MGALLKLLLLAVLVVWLLYSPAMRGLLGGILPGQKGSKGAKGTAAREAPRPQPTSPPRPADEIVPCVHCGLHLPLSEAKLDVGGRTYCNDAHRLAGPRT